MLESGSYKKYGLRKAVGDCMIFYVIDVFEFENVAGSIFIYLTARLFYIEIFCDIGVFMSRRMCMRDFLVVVYKQREETEDLRGKRRNCGEKEKNSRQG